MKCGICSKEIPGAVRALNQHKAEAHPEERAAARAQRKARVAHRGVSMNYCQSCSKFVSFEPGEPEDEGIEVDTDGNISGSVRLLLTCADCAQEMAEVSIDIEDAIEVEHEAEDCNADLSIECSIEMGEEGGGRFSKHLYYAEVALSLTCNDCDAKAEGTITSEKVAASSFESCQ